METSFQLFIISFFSLADCTTETAVEVCGIGATDCSGKRTSPVCTCGDGYIVSNDGMACIKRK